jgi:spore coat protein H
MTKLFSVFTILLIFLACRKTEVIFDGTANENLELPLLLNLDGKSCVFDAKNRVLKYAVLESDLENFAPVVEFQEYSEITFNKKKLMNGIVNEFGDIELNEPYPIQIKTEDEIGEFTFIFTDIPIVQIVSHDPIINGPKTLCRLILNYPNKEIESADNWVGIEQRGRSSLVYDKKSFGIEIFADKSTEISQSQAYFDFKPNQKWILDAMFIDQSRLRNKTSFELWQSMTGPANHIGVESQFVEVFINHQPQGLYCFMEIYTEEFLDLNSQSVLYKGTDNSIITQFENLPDSPPGSSHWADWEQEYPNPSDVIVWDDFEILSTLIVNGDNTLFKNNIAQLIDIENVIDYFLFINLCGGLDNVGKNWFFFKRDQASKFNIIPWDMDGTWGRNSFAEESNYYSVITNHFFKRLEATNPEDYNMRLKERWDALRLGLFSEINLLNLFDANFNELSTFEIIDIENKLWQINLNLETEESYITSWITNRLTFLDEHFD